MKTYDIRLNKISTLTAPVVEEVNRFLEEVRQFIRVQYLPAMPGIDGAINNAYTKKYPHGMTPQDYADQIQLRGIPFVIRYDATSDHVGLRPHKDNADVSFVLLLSDPNEFEGGGTYIEAIDETIMLKQGEAVVLNGQLVHSAQPISHGRRYVLSGFTNFKADFLDIKRRDTLATMTLHL
eukprot:SAG31_NODE_3369_length_4354_cov_4.327380_5_plen_180_part_00